MQQKYFVFTLNTVGMIVAFVCANSLLTGLAAVFFWGPIIDFWANYFYCAIEIAAIGWYWITQKWKKKGQK